MYDGANEGEPLWFWGLWTISGDKGGFHLWPEGEPDPTQKRTGAQIEAPQDEKKRVRVPADLLPF